MQTWPAASLIRAKRRGETLDARQCASLARGVADGSWSEGQIAAYCMAVAWRGMTPAECRDFTLALRDSGRCLDWSDLPGRMRYIADLFRAYHEDAALFSPPFPDH